MSFTIKASNYRAHKDTVWTIPEGMSAVVGVNGSGKTTLLMVGDILRRAVDPGSSGLGAAIEEYSGAGHIRNFHALPEDHIQLGVTVDGISWEIEPHPQGAGISENAAERLMVDGAIYFERAAGNATLPWNGKTISTGSRTVLQRLGELDLDGTFPGKKILDTLAGYRLHYDLDLRSLRRGSPDTTHKFLHKSGYNAFSVLRNWRDWSGDAFRYEFVVDSLKACFGFFEKLDFQKGGNTIEGYLVHRGGGISPAWEAANGWLAALGQFTAVASANAGDIVAIDEIENSLHPRAVREMLTCIQSYSERKKLSVVLATQSAEVLNWFNGQPERVYVMDRRMRPAPQPLTDMRTAEWLEHFQLGDKYAEGDFGGEESDL